MNYDYKPVENALGKGEIITRGTEVFERYEAINGLVARISPRKADDNNNYPFLFTLSYPELNKFRDDDFALFKDITDKLSTNGYLIPNDYNSFKKYQIGGYEQDGFSFNIKIDTDEWYRMLGSSFPFENGFKASYIGYLEMQLKEKKLQKFEKSIKTFVQSKLVAFKKKEFISHMDLYIDATYVFTSKINKYKGISVKIPFSSRDDAMRNLYYFFNINSIPDIHIAPDIVEVSVSKSQLPKPSKVNIPTVEEMKNGAKPTTIEQRWLR